MTEILQSIQLGCVDFPKDQLKVSGARLVLLQSVRQESVIDDSVLGPQKFPELKFRYVEEEQPEEFFIPYVWSMVHSTSSLYWSTEALITLEN